MRQFATVRDAVLQLLPALLDMSSSALSSPLQFSFHVVFQESVRQISFPFSLKKPLEMCGARLMEKIEEAGKKKENRRGRKRRKRQNVRGSGVKSKSRVTLKQQREHKRASYSVCVCLTNHPGSLTPVGVEYSTSVQRHEQQFVLYFSLVSWYLVILSTCVQITKGSHCCYATV